MEMLPIVPRSGSFAPDALGGFQDPRREIRIGGTLIGVVVIGFLGWSLVARLDSAIHAPGVVRVAGNHQAVQSPTGGVVSAVYAHEGDRVRRGDILVQFATTEALAQERSLASRVIGLEVEIARIRAEQSGAARIAPPPEWTALDATEREDGARALAGEESNMRTRRALRAAERAVLNERIAQISEQVGGYQQRQSSNSRQRALNEDELDGVQQLYHKGYATKTRVLALQRSAASIDGDIGTASAEIARLRTSAGETRMQMMQLASQHDQENSERLRAAQTELETVLPQWKAAREQLGRSAVRAPASGTVIGLVANTNGGVAAAGQKLMEIVPDEGRLEIESRISVADANDVQPGQRADLRIDGFNNRNLPVLHGRVSRISADSIVEEHSDRAFFTATISVPRRELDRISRDAGIAGSLRVGTAVDAMIPLKRRTAFDYWMGPLKTRLRPALTER